MNAQLVQNNCIEYFIINNIHKTDVNFISEFLNCIEYFMINNVHKTDVNFISDFFQQMLLYKLYGTVIVCNEYKKFSLFKIKNFKNKSKSYLLK